MTTATQEKLIDELLLRHKVEQFYNLEADLLDNRQFDAWLDLLAEDIRYWMPLARNQEFGHWQAEYSREGQDLNWFDEGKFELRQRVAQIMTGLHWAEEPASRTSHMFSNLQVWDDGDENYRSACRFLVYRNRTETETDFYLGKRRDHLRQDGEDLKICRREILLDQNVLLAKNLTTFF